MPLKRNHIEVVDSFDPKPYEVRGVRRWCVDVSFVHNGIPVRLQRRGFLSRGAALTFVETEIALIRAGVKSATEPKTAKTKTAAITVQDAFETIFAWWRSSGRKKESTIFVDRHCVQKHLLPVLGELPWSRLTQAQVDRLIADAQDMPTPRHLSVFKAAVRDSRRAGLDAPAVLVDVPRRVHANRTDFISVVELDRICAKASPRMAAAFRFMFHTGLRIGEFLSLEWGDLDLGNQRETMTVKRTACAIKGGFSVSSPKNGKHRTVPLNRSANAALIDIAQATRPGKGMYPPPDAPLSERLVFPADSGGYMNKHVPSTALHRACDAAGIRRISPHVLRHSFGSNLAQAGVDIYDICTLMGHSSVAMTQRYAHLSQDGLRSSARKLDTLSRLAKKSH